MGVAGEGRDTVGSVPPIPAAQDGPPLLVAPAWAAPAAARLGVERVESFTDGLRARPRARVVVVDQAARGTDVTNRRDAVGALAARHADVLVVSSANHQLHYLLPCAEDGPVPTNVDFVDGTLTLGALGNWLGSPVPAREVDVPAFSSDYLPKASVVRRDEPFTGFKRVYVALDESGDLAVAGAFGLNYGPLANTRECGHEPKHPSLGPDCFHGFAAYRHREDALLFRAPDAAVAEVELTGDVIGADSWVVSPGMRGEHQLVVALQFPTRCDCGAAATLLRVSDPDADDFRELQPSCRGCIEGVTTRDIGDLDGGSLRVGWLEA